MLAGSGGSIVNIASTAASVGFPNGAEYCASKAGVMGLVRGGAIDYATKGIRINAVLPGGTLTPVLKGAMANDPGDRKRVGSGKRVAVRLDLGGRRNIKKKKKKQEK